MSRSELFIAGRWRPGRGPELVSAGPYGDDERWRGPAASAEDAAEAVAAARAAFPDWAATPLSRRQEIARGFAQRIADRAEDLARLIGAEVGKPVWEARTEVQAVIGKIEISIRAQAARAGESTEATAFGAATLAHRPYGVMAVLGPFNFPAHLPNGHITPALLAGDAVVFKPSELAPATAAFMAEQWAEAGLPAGVLNVVPGARETGEALLAQPIDGVLFTGSSAVGTAIHRRFAGRPEVILALEMGGNNPLIVWPPGDPAAAANLIAHSAFITSGQRCACARRLILPVGAEGDRVLDALLALAARLEVRRSGAEPEAFLGPLASEAAARRAEAAAEELIARGAAVLAPVRRGGPELAPAVFEVTGVAAPDEEIFAPFLQVLRVDSLEAAIAAANATRYGLAAGVLSEDPAVWAAVEPRLRAGVINWNRPTTGASSALPFGGPGLSGSGRPSAWYAADYCAFPVAGQTAPRLTPIPAPGL